MREPDVRELQADLRNAIRNIPHPQEREAAEKALDGILKQYNDACQKIGEMLSDKGRIGDREVITMYSGDATRHRRMVDGDAAHMCVVVRDSEGDEREVYCGSEFDKATIPPSTR